MQKESGDDWGILWGCGYKKNGCRSKKEEFEWSPLNDDRRAFPPMTKLLPGSSTSTSTLIFTSDSSVSSLTLSLRFVLQFFSSTRFLLPYFS